MARLKEDELRKDYESKRVSADNTPPYEKRLRTSWLIARREIGIYDSSAHSSSALRFLSYIIITPWNVKNNSFLSKGQPCCHNLRITGNSVSKSHMYENLIEHLTTPQSANRIIAVLRVRKLFRKD